MEELELIRASDIQCREIEWLWYPFIPYGKVTVLQGDSGDGKSLMILKLAAMLTRGEPMPFTDGEGQEPINVIYQSSEDDADDTIVPLTQRTVPCVRSVGVEIVRRGVTDGISNCSKHTPICVAPLTHISVPSCYEKS